MSSRRPAQHSDVEVMVGATADTADEPPGRKTAEDEEAKDMSSASVSATRLKHEFFSGSMIDDPRYYDEARTSVASTMTPFRCVSPTVLTEKLYLYYLCQKWLNEQWRHFEMNCWHQPVVLRDRDVRLCWL